MGYIIEQLKNARQTLGTKQSVLGQKLGLPQSHISKIESERTDPRLSTITDMARILDQEIMLIPRHLVPYVRSIIRGKDTHQPRWKLDEEIEK
jgi:HTH-type transcriptional regulator / antitoxin HipB